ncbi:MAG: hypothetical protein Kow0075_09500 [Salibacteraceae bacterium]
MKVKLLVSIILSSLAFVAVAQQQDSIAVIPPKQHSQHRFALFGHRDSVALHMHNPHISDSLHTNGYFHKHRDSLVKHHIHFKHLKKYHSGLYVVTMQDHPVNDLFEDIQKESNLHFSIIGNIDTRLTTRVESFSLKHIIDEICYQAGWVAVAQLNQIVVYGNGAEEILKDQKIIYEYIPRFMKTDELLNAVTDLSENVEIKKQPANNSIFVSGTLSEVKSAISYLRFFDVPPKTVMIELLVVEYKHGNSFNWSFDITSGSTGRLSDINYRPGSGGSFSYNFLSSLNPNFKVNLSSLVENNYANIVTNPHVIAKNNEPASISIQESKYVRLEQATINGVTTNLRQLKTGILLKVTPTIMSNELMELELDAENSFFLPQENEGEISTLSNVLNTKVLIKNGETLIIGGLIKAEEDDAVGGFPILRKIPLIGLLFRKSNKRKNYLETVIYITPYIDPLTPVKGLRSLDMLEKINDKLNKEERKLERKAIRKLY